MANTPVVQAAFVFDASDPYGRMVAGYASREEAISKIRESIEDGTVAKTWYTAIEVYVDGRITDTFTSIGNGVFEYVEAASCTRRRIAPRGAELEF